MSLRPTRIPRITPDDPSGSSRFGEFEGVINTRSRADLGVKALYAGDNVQISDSKKVARRAGYSLLRAGNVKSVAGWYDDMYLIIDDTLVHRLDDGFEIVLQTGLSGGNYGWDEINGDAYYLGGMDAGIVRNSTVRPWRVAAPPACTVEIADIGSMPTTVLNTGATYATATFRFCATYTTEDGRESAPSDVSEIRAPVMTKQFRVAVDPAYAATNIYVTDPDGAVFNRCAVTKLGLITVDPTTKLGHLDPALLGCTPLPMDCSNVEFWNGRAYVAEYVPQVDMSVVWCSKPFAFHIFDQSTDVIVLPGELSMMEWCNQGMMLGTTKRVWNYTVDGQLNELVNYGMVPGKGADTTPESITYFWTTRGFCKAMPFENLTEANISMAPGTSVTTCLAYQQGMQQMLAVTAGGGNPFNARTERT